MGASPLMSLGTKAMTANYAALATTGHNIANANVIGYSRQQAELATATGQFTGAGFFGKGVDVSTVSRAHDSFLTREAATSRSLAALDKTRFDLLQQMENVFPTGEMGVGHAAGQFLNSMVDLASRPTDSATRQVVLARATEVADRFAAAGAQLDVLQVGVREDLKATVAQVNQIARSIADLNQSIAAVIGLGQPPNDLLDKRERLISDLSQHLQLSTVAADDGSLAIFIAGGQRLVLGTQTQPLTVEVDPRDATRAALGLSENGFVRVLQDSELGGGAIAGLLRFQNNDLVDARTQLGQMAAALAGKVNEQQSLGLDLGDPPGSGAAIFSVGAPQALANANNAVNGAGQFVGRINLVITDTTQLAASEYELRADPAGSPGVWQLTRLADGLVRNVASGDVLDGMRIDIGPPAPASGDRFLLQPVTRAANGMRRVLDDVRGLAAASPVTASLGSANLGTASVASLRVVSASLNASLDAAFSFTSATGDYSWTLTDRSSNAVVSSGNGVWSAGAPIVLNGFELQLNGVPRPGDRVDVGKTLYPAVNNGNALAFVQLRDAAIVGRAPLSAGGVGGGATITDAYATLMAGVGVRVQGAASASGISTSVANQAELARSSRSGVNLDEEAARLIQYQQSYQAAAKILQIAQSIFDTLLQTTGR
ncbi:MAG: flagellar hook-associated protein FlgK [Rubrivivax sp.]